MIEKIIFDYGGVLTKGSRSAFVTDSLGDSREQQKALLEFFKSDFIMQAAEGKHSSDEVLIRLQLILGEDSVSRIQNILTSACKPDSQLLHLLKQLKVSYRVYVISDSLPPYSEYLLKELTHIVDGLFLSDQLGSRKSGHLFTLAETVCPNLFVNSVYIDDREINLGTPKARGAIGLLFKSKDSLIKDLNRLGAVFEN